MATSLKNLKCYIMTANQSMGALQASSYLLNKFWPVRPEVNVLGYDEPTFDLPDNYNFISLGKQRGLKYWSDDMIDFFSQCDDDLFYLTFEDAFIIRTIDEELLQYCYDFCLNNLDENLLRFNLSADLQTRPHHVVESYDNFDLIEADQSAIFRLSLNHSIWNRKGLLSKLVRGETPHFFENPKKSNSKFDGLGVYGFKKRYPLIYSEGYRRGKKVPNPFDNLLYPHGGISKLNSEDIEVINKNNWLPII